MRLFLYNIAEKLAAIHWKPYVDGLEPVQLYSCVSIPTYNKKHGLFIAGNARSECNTGSDELTRSHVTSEACAMPEQDTMFSFALTRCALHVAQAHDGAETWNGGADIPVPAAGPPLRKKFAQMLSIKTHKSKGLCWEILPRSCLDCAGGSGAHLMSCVWDCLPIHSLSAVLAEAWEDMKGVCFSQQLVKGLGFRWSATLNGRGKRL